MRLSWQHDGIATALVAGAGALYGAYEIGPPVAGFGAARMVSAGVVVLGIGACAASGGAPDTSNGWQTFVAWLGAITFVAAFVGMAWGSVLALRIAVGTTVGIWALTTGRRAFAARPTAVEAPTERRDLTGSLR
jgi:hypothetical protein